MPIQNNHHLFDVTLVSPFTYIKVRRIVSRMSDAFAFGVRSHLGSRSAAIRPDIQTCSRHQVKKECLRSRKC